MAYSSILYTPLHDLPSLGIDPELTRAEDDIPDDRGLGKKWRGGRGVRGPDVNFRHFDYLCLLYSSRCWLSGEV